MLPNMQPKIIVTTTANIYDTVNPHLNTGYRIKHMVYDNSAGKILIYLEKQSA